MPRTRTRTSFKTMKSLLPYLALPVFAITGAHAQQAPQQAEAFLIYEEGDVERVWITAATAVQIRYKGTEQAVDTEDAKIDEFQSIYILEPPALSEAIELYQGRKYAEAKDKLAAVKLAFKPIEELPDNPSTLAGYLELECLRKLGDFDGLAKALETFDKAGLTREYQQRQIELYAMWDAVRTKDWSRLENICVERLKERMPGFQRAQIGYCLGLALDSQDKLIPAINAYNIAMTADTGASEDITRTATENSLRLYKKDPDVQTAIKLWGTPDEVVGSSGHQRLLEAAALAELYELSLGGGQPLPADFKDLLKYVKKSEPAAAPEKEEPKKEK
jgi:tetratricopeptide (TPR) repeat protein